MYKLSNEITGRNVLYIVLSILITLLSIYANDKSSIVMCYCLLLLEFVSIIRSIFKYLSLKKHGTKIDNLKYHFEHMNKYERLMIVEFEYENNHYRLYKNGSKISRDIPEEGTTSVLLNLNKPKQYFIFNPLKED